jgi:hypothetical protein
MRIVTNNGPGMTIFSPDDKYGYVCLSFTPETVVVSVADHTIVGRVPQASPFCPNIAATPDGTQVWFTLKDTGKTEVFNAKPPFNVLKVIDTGPITNHANIVRATRTVSLPMLPLAASTKSKLPGAVAPATAARRRCSGRARHSGLRPSSGSAGSWRSAGR